MRAVLPFQSSRLSYVPLDSAALDSPGSVKRFHAVVVDAHVRRYLMDGQVMPEEWSREAVVASADLFRRRDVGLWLAYEAGKAGGEPLGFCGFAEFPEIQPEPQLLYALREGAQGRGYATEMGEALVARAWAAGGFERIFAAVDEPNAASIRVLEKLGFLEERRFPGSFGAAIVYAGPGMRLATVADAPALSDLVNSAYRGESSKQGWTTEADLLGGQRTDPEILREIVRDPGAVILVVAEGPASGERLEACVLLRRKGDHAYLGMLTTRPTRQSKGIGKRVLAAAEGWAARAWAVSRIEMTVIRQRAELIAWYGRRGYRDTGRREPFPVGDARFGVPRVGGLEFAVLAKEI